MKAPRPHITTSTATNWNEVQFPSMSGDMLPGVFAPCEVGTEVDGRLKFTVPLDAVPGSRHRAIVNQTDIAQVGATVTLTRDPTDRNGAYTFLPWAFPFYVDGPNVPAGFFVAKPGETLYVTVCTSIGAKVATPGLRVTVRFELE